MREVTWRHTAVGYLIHHAMSIMWATLYERLFGSRRHEKTDLRICAEAATLAALAFVVDYGCAPRRLRPGFRKHLARRSIFVVYASFAVGVALASLLRARRKRVDG